MKTAEHFDRLLDLIEEEKEAEKEETKRELDRWPVQVREARGKTVTRLIIVGNNVTRDYVILREISLQEGKTFWSGSLARDLQNLENLAIFSSIRVNPPRCFAARLSITKHGSPATV